MERIIVKSSQINSSNLFFFKTSGIINSLIHFHDFFQFFSIFLDVPRYLSCETILSRPTGAFIAKRFSIMVCIAPKVFLLNGANNSKNSTNFLNSIPHSIFLILNSSKQLFTFGAGLKHFAGTHFKYFTSYA